MPVVIETPRTLLRHLTHDDFAALYSLTGDAESMRYMGDGNPISAESTRRWIEVSQEKYAAYGYGNLAVIEKTGGQFIGFAGFVRSRDVTPPREAELIYALLPTYRGKGIASEIAGALVTYGFSTLGFRRILATIDPANRASVRLVERLGFVLTEHKTDEHGLETLFFWHNAPEQPKMR